MAKLFVLVETSDLYWFGLMLLISDFTHKCACKIKNKRKSIVFLFQQKIPVHSLFHLKMYKLFLL